MESTQFSDLAHRAATAAGEILRSKFNSALAIRSKAPADMVTEADVAAEQLIATMIRDAFPAHDILAEEAHAGRVDAEHLWIVDPLDGTTNFVHGIPHVAVSIAYYHAGIPEIAVIYNPLRDDLYTAVRGQGAFRNGEPATVSHDALTDSLIGVGFYYDRGAMMRATLAAIQDLFSRQIHGIRRFGTASLDLCMVGSGQIAAYFEYQLSPWDFAAGRLFVTEAGGIVTDCAGDEPAVRVSSVLAGSPEVHAAALPIVRAHLAAALSADPSRGS